MQILRMTLNAVNSVAASDVIARLWKQCVLSWLLRSPCLRSWICVWKVIGTVSEQFRSSATTQPSKTVRIFHDFVFKFTILTLQAFKTIPSWCHWRPHSLVSSSLITHELKCWLWYVACTQLNPTPTERLNEMITGMVLHFCAPKTDRWWCRQVLRSTWIIQHSYCFRVRRCEKGHFYV